MAERRVEEGSANAQTVGGQDGLQRALRGVKWEQLRPLMLQAGMGSEHVVSTLSLAELQSRFVEHMAPQAGLGGGRCLLYI